MKGFILYHYHTLFHLRLLYDYHSPQTRQWEKDREKRKSLRTNLLDGNEYAPRLSINDADV